MVLQKPIGYMPLVWCDFLDQKRALPVRLFLLWSHLKQPILTGPSVAKRLAWCRTECNCSRNDLPQTGSRGFSARYRDKVGYRGLNPTYHWCRCPQVRGIDAMDEVPTPAFLRFLPLGLPTVGCRKSPNG